MPGWMLAGLLLALATAMPLAWKWQLGVRRAAIVVAVLGAASGTIVGWARRVVALDDWTCAGAVWLLSLGAAVALLAYRFYRDPERKAPARDDVLVSPADGVVIYVRTSDGGMLPVSDKHGRRYPLAELTKTTFASQEAVTVGISMNFADVHVNRAPVDGRVVFSRHFPGLFGSLRRPEMLFENERATTIIERDDLQVAVVQIASRLVRKISVFVRQGEAVARGQRLGVIRFGSQVDIVLPVRRDLRITSRVGDRLTAGESVIAVIERTPAAVAPSQASQRAHRSEPSAPMRGALVIGEHCRGLGLVRSLGRQGIPVWTLEPEGERLASSSRYSRRRLPWPGSEADQLNFLHKLAATEDVVGWALFPTNDETTALFARHHADLSKHFRVTVPPWDVLAPAYDKRLTYQLAAGIGIDVPRTFSSQTREALKSLDITYPVVLKPAFKKEDNRFTHDKAWRVDDLAALTERYDEACELVGAEVVMIQELIPGRGDTQFSHAALCSEGRTLASVTARRTRQYPVEFGHSSSFVETVNEPAIADAAGRLLAAMRYTGIAEVEFKFDRRDGRYKLLDVNPRVWTWHALCGAAGVDFPWLLWRSIRGEAVAGLRARPGVRWVRMGTDLAAAWRGISRGHLSVREYVRSLRPPIQFSVFAADDPVPALVRIPLLAGSCLRRLCVGPRLVDSRPAVHALAAQDER